MPSDMWGDAGTLPDIIRRCSAADVWSTRVESDAPSTYDGWIVTISMPRSCAVARAALSASVFDLGYASAFSATVQSSGVKVRPCASGPRPAEMAATDDVSTTRRTPSAAAAETTALDPSTAGGSSSASVAPVTNGEATWHTYAQPRHAERQASPSDATRSASTSSMPGQQARRWPTLAASDASRTVPRTA